MGVESQKLVGGCDKRCWKLVSWLLLAVGLVFNSNTAGAVSGNSVISGQICAHSTNSAELVVDSPAPDATVVNSPTTINFSGRWLRKVVTKKAATILATTELPYGDNQTFNQSVALTHGVNNLTFEITGGCPETTMTRSLTINYNSITATINPLITTETSPALSGTTTSSTHQIWLTINGKTYQATNNGGTWMLAAGVITPDLSDGSYTVKLEVKTADGVTVWSDEFTKTVVIDTTPPEMTIDAVASDGRSPEIKGTISDAAAKITVTINGKTYQATNNGDGTWVLAAGTISRLASGAYEMVIQATDAAGNSVTISRTLTIKAKGELGFILPPNTGFLRIGQVNVASWLLYLGLISLIVGVKILLNRKSKSVVSSS